MTRFENFAEIVTTWAHREPSVQGLVLIGSQVRASNDQVWHADAYSDWDFQVITSDLQLFADAKWTNGLTGAKILTYAMRDARLADISKISTIFTGAEADFVLMPVARVERMRQAIEFGKREIGSGVERDLQSLAIVIRPGWRFLKGAEIWEPFYRNLISEVPDLRIDDAMVRNLAESFVCDYVWALRKLERGELLTVQRILHRELTETNFRLLHELKLRHGQQSFPDARRLERVATPEELSSVSVSALLDAASLRAALAQSAASLRTVVRALIGGTLHWPNV